MDYASIDRRLQALESIETSGVQVASRIAWYYDTTATAWLSVAEYPVQLTFPTAIATIPGLATFNATTTLIYVPLRSDYAPYVTRVEAVSRVNTTNDATNNWSVLLRGYDLTLAANTTIHSYTTSADTVNVLTEHALAPNGTATPTNRRYMRLSTVRNNAPGTLDLLLTAFYRLIRP